MNAKSFTTPSLTPVAPQWAKAIVFHFSIALLLWSGAHLFLKPAPSELVDLTLVDPPSPQSRPTRELRPISQQKPQTKASQQNQVFGLTRTSQTDSESEVAVKQGNTLAKEQDLKTLKPEDADELPIPADEFTLTQMPKLISEIRIAYPPEAKAKNIQGVVITEILIGTDGLVKQVSLINGPGYGLNEAALQAIKQFKFAPAKVGETSVASKIRYAYKFILEK